MRLYRWISRWLPWLRRRQAEQEIQRELDLHLELETQHQLRAGHSAKDAARAARLAVGNAQVIREDARAVWGWRWWDVLRREGRAVARGIHRRPGFSALVILIVALGVGTTTAVFSVVNAVLLAPLPFHDPDRLVTVQVTVRELEDQFPRFASNLRLFVAWGECRVTCAAVAALRAAPWALTGDGEPSALRGARVTDNFFELLGIAPALGRAFGTAGADHRSDREVVLTHGVWQQAFGGDPSVVGRLITLDGERVEVVGVLPASFWFPRYDVLYPLPVDFGTLDVFRPLRFTEEEANRPGEFDFPVIVRLADDAATDQLQAELAALTNASYDGLSMTITPIVRPLAEPIVEPVRASLWWLLAAVGAVFAMCCINVASLLAAQGLRRRQDVAVRRAIGASTRQLVGHACAESMVLAAPGGIAGVLLAAVCLRVVVAAAPIDLPRLSTVSIDTTVLAFATGLTVLSAVVCALIPAWRASRADPDDVLGTTTRTVSDDRSVHRIGDVLVTSEVALTTIVLLVSGLLVTSFIRVLAVDRGFDVNQVVAADLTLPVSRYASPSTRTQFFDALLADLTTIPGVEAVAISQRLPLEGVSSVNALVPVGAFDPTVEVPTGNYRFISPDYVRTMGMTLSRGRLFTDRDRGQRVALVTASTADRLWPDRDPIGQQFHRGTPERPPQTVVGVLADARILGQESDPGLVAYLPYWEAPPGAVALGVRSAMERSSVVAVMREAVSALDPLLPLADVRVMEEVFQGSVATRRFLMQLTSGFAGAGLLLVCLGIVGVVSGGVERRRHEFAVRAALGAARGRLLRLVLMDGLRPVVAGLLVGLAGALALGQLVTALLFGVTPSDPTTVAGVIVLVIGVALAACLVPGVRATRVTPADALRAE